MKKYLSKLTIENLEEKKSKFIKRLRNNIRDLTMIRDDIMEKKFYAEPYYAALELTWLKEYEEDPKNCVYSYEPRNGTVVLEEWVATR